jgi:hypothetical protein
LAESPDGGRVTAVPGWLCPGWLCGMVTVRQPSCFRGAAATVVQCRFQPLSSSAVRRLLRRAAVW